MKGDGYETDEQGGIKTSRGATVLIIILLVILTWVLSYEAD